MRKKWLFASLLSFLCVTSVMAYELPLNALTYGMVTPSNAADDAPYGGSAASSEFVICKKEAETGGQFDACLSDEVGRINSEINALMNTIADSKVLPADVKGKYISGVKTDLYRIDYLCNVFNVDDTGKIKNNDFTSVYSCQLNRLSVLKASIIKAVNEL